MISRRTALLALPLAGVSGCATIESWITNPLIAAGIEEAVNMFLGAALSALGPNALTTAEQIVTGITAIISAVTGKTVTLETLQLEADDAISASSLPPLAQTALEDAIELVVAALSPGGVTSSTSLSTVLSYAQKGAQLYVAAATSQRGKALLFRMHQTALTDEHGKALVDSFGHAITTR
jgi:hypothetical protein